MNKRMKDPKGDLRFVHKLTRIYDFSSLKLTAMACRRQVLRTWYCLAYEATWYIVLRTLYNLATCYLILIPMLSTQLGLPHTLPKCHWS
jgi:hypothetical protein